MQLSRRALLKAAAAALVAVAVPVATYGKDYTAAYFRVERWNITEYVDGDFVLRRETYMRFQACAPDHPKAMATLPPFPLESGFRRVSIDQTMDHTGEWLSVRIVDVQQVDPCE